MRGARALSAVPALALALGLGGCRNDMHHQAKVKPFRESTFFADGASARALPDGTVARGFLREDAALSRGQGADGKFVEKIPVEITRALLLRGQERFNIYCTPCHDRTGSGRGIVALRSSWLASDLTEARVRQMPDGQIFDTITHGKRSMPAYRFQVSERDRWAIVAYVRALERAAAGTLADVPQELRSELR